MIYSILLLIPLITVIASVILIVPIFLGTINMKEWKKDDSLRIIFIYCIVYALFEIIGWYYALNHWQNHFLTNTLTYLNLYIWGYYFYTIISNLNHRKVVILIVLLSTVVMLWSNTTNANGYNYIDSTTHSVSNIAILAMSLLFFYQLLNNLDINNLLNYSHFWISVGVLVYFSGIFFVHIFSEFITFNKDESVIQFWSVEDYLLFFQRIFLAIGLWFSKTPPQLSPSSK
jgi:hypothetical protein